MALPTPFAALKASVLEWINREDFSDDLVTLFVRGAEQKFNAELRVDRMIKTEDASIISCCAPLPDDWLEMDLVRLVDVSYKSGFYPLEYKPREEFFRTPTTSYGYYKPPFSTFGDYTIEGRQIFIGGPPDNVNGRQLRIDYYGEVPVFTDSATSWIYIKYPLLYLYAAVMHANLHAVGEEQSAVNYKQLTEGMIQQLNVQHLRARASGSRLTRTRIRSFG